jgi:hypothetical protein
VRRLRIPRRLRLRIRRHLAEDGRTKEYRIARLFSVRIK